MNAKDDWGKTPLHSTAEMRHKETAELLIAKGADVNAKRDDGITPLDSAIVFNRSETADLLRKHGGKAKTPNISIHEAAKKGNIEAVKQHLANGADVNAKDNRGSTPIDYSIVNKQPETADLLRKHGGISGAADSIHVAAELGNAEAVKQHLASGADVNAKGQFGTTPLREAAFEGHKEIAELLIANGADVNAKHGNGWTPLHDAAYEGQKEIVELLISEGAKVNAQNDGGLATNVNVGQLGLIHCSTDTARFCDQAQPSRNRRPSPQTRRQDE